tara:strand:- start:626 stop:754 length:129 start_codon:yes stop_codon:yes gene_type:complete
LEILAKHHCGEIENSNKVADFEAISARNKWPIVKVFEPPGNV